MPRPDNRDADQLRPVKFHLDYLKHPRGSVLIEMGDTRVICAASVWPGTPRWMREQNVPGGWITAEYDMLPAATGQRRTRAITRGKPDSRGTEIQRLVGRSLRAMVDLAKLPPVSLYIDCDVIDADGGTRCASVTGGAVAMQIALRRMFLDGDIKTIPVVNTVAAVSVGIVAGEAVLDLCYAEDVDAEVDMNVVMTGDGKFVEVQGTAETGAFTRAENDRMLDLAAKGCRDLIQQQKKVLGPR